jgi:hypothetical protein
MLLSVAAHAEPRGELFTAPGAILCIQSDNVPVANDKRIIQHPTVLKRMGCIRSPGGVPIKIVERPDADGPWMVRFFPEGISRGVILWGLADAFAAADGSRPAAVSGVDS